MGKKYSINSAGRIVAERDIYSLGGIIPKGRLGAKVANETQIAQEGECWVAGGDISTRPDVIVKDNAYIGDFFSNESPVHTDGSMIFSGNTLIPGHITIRCPQADPKNNVLVKDSFIGISMDVLCGPASTATAFPFEQGRYNQDAPKGSLFTGASMKIDAENFVRNTATLRLGKNTYVYLPVGFNARIYWAYYDTSNQLAYSGQSETVSSNLYKLSHPVYNVCMIAFAKNPTLTPAELGASGAKILGHVSGSLLTDLRPESVSGEYVMDNSSFIMPTNNFGLATTQLRFLAGGLYNTNMYTPTDRQDYKPYGTFRNVEHLEYSKYLGDSYRTVATRDRAVSAYDCPLLRLDDLAFNDTMIQLGDLTLRRCIVPKGVFRNDAVNGNTYEDIDFSYANEDLGFNIPGYTNFLSSHKEGLYRLDLSGGFTNGLVSHKGNLDPSARLFPDIEKIPLDGNIIEQGSYLIAFDKYYEDQKVPVADRVRTGKPLPTKGAVFPTITTGFKVSSIVYLRDDFRIQTSQTDPTSIDTANPYFVMNIAKTDNSPITASEFVSLGLLLRRSEYSKVPEITGSAYVGAGCTVRGDVQLHGDPYVNRVFDINEWDRGGLNTAPGLTWDVMKDGRNSDVRMTTKSIYPVNPGDTISVSGAYRILLCWFNEDRKLMSDTGWNDGTLTVPANVHYVGIALSTKPDLKFLDFSDVPLAGVKYLRAFKKRRYITNELDQKSPEDILLADYYWEQGAFYTDTGRVGRPYNDIKYTQSDRLRLSKPLPAGNATLTVANYWEYAMAKFDAGTRLLESSSEGYSMVSMTLRKAPPVTVNPSDAKDARLVITCIPQPRIIVPYGSNTLNINGVKIRMYDNAVLSRNFNQEGSITLQGDAVMGYDFDSGACLCSNGHSDAIIKLP